MGVESNPKQADARTEWMDDEEESNIEPSINLSMEDKNDKSDHVIQEEKLDIDEDADEAIIVKQAKLKELDDEIFKLQSQRRGLQTELGPRNCQPAVVETEFSPIY